MLLLVSMGSCWWAWRRRRAMERGKVESGKNPFELDMAIKFGIVFGVVVFVARAAELYFGEAGLYLAAAIAGLTDVDAITLAIADLAKSGAHATDVAARAIIIAVAANNLVKSAMAISLGSPELRRLMLPTALCLLVAGVGAALIA